MAAILQTIFSHSFSCMKMVVSVQISPKFVLNGQISNIPLMDQIVAWSQIGHKPLSEPMMA